MTGGINAPPKNNTNQSKITKVVKSLIKGIGNANALAKAPNMQQIDKADLLEYPPYLLTTDPPNFYFKLVG